MPRTIAERSALELSDAELHREQDRLIALEERTEQDEARWEQIVTERRRRLLRHADDPGRQEMADFSTGGGRGGQADGGSQIRAQALRCNERAEFLPERARQHMEQMLRQDDDPENRLARFTVTLSDRDYFRAFAAWMRDPQGGRDEWSDTEREAVRRVRHLERAMSLGVGSGGGFLVPYELDPNIVVTASYQDPMRQISRVETTAANEKRFVTSAGSTSSWDPEATEVSDDSPVLAQPTVTAKKAMTFVPVTFELYEDSDIAQQIARVFAESKAAHESLSFTLSQTNGPIGLISALIAAGGSVVIATATAVLGATDAYGADAALPARWRGNASWMAHAAIINGYRQLAKAANIQESLVDDSQTPPRMANHPVYENSNMDGALAAGNDYVLALGDFNQYAIVDRVGATIEVVPHLLGGTGATHYPTGQRGFLQHWRVGADVLVADAFRLVNIST